MNFFRVGTKLYQLDEPTQRFRSKQLAGYQEWSDWREYDHLTPPIPEIGSAVHIDHGDGGYTMTGLVEETDAKEVFPVDTRTTRFVVDTDGLTEDAEAREVPVAWWGRPSRRTVKDGSARPLAGFKPEDEQPEYAEHVVVAGFARPL